MYAIEATDLVKSFNKKIILYNFSIQIPTGSIYGLLGPNGAGKSTFIRIISGLDKQDSGQLSILGTSPSRKVKKQLGIAPQENSFYLSLTCFENLMYYAALYGVKESDARIRADELLTLLGIKEKRDAPTAYLSGGMKRRLNLACALMHKPKILILDEPTTGLDPLSRIKMWNVVKEINQKEGATIILTTHYMEEAEELCSEISFVNKGHVVRTGTPGKLKSIIGKQFLRIKSEPGNYESIIPLLKKIDGVRSVSRTDHELIIESKNAATKTASVIHLLDKAEEKILDMRISEATLEDAFIKLTGSGLKEGKNETLR